MSTLRTPCTVSPITHRFLGCQSIFLQFSPLLASQGLPALILSALPASSRYLPPGMWSPSKRYAKSKPPIVYLASFVLVQTSLSSSVLSSSEVVPLACLSVFAGVLLVLSPNSVAAARESRGRLFK